jgi:hypothetical protein
VGLLASKLIPNKVEFRGVDVVIKSSQREISFLPCLGRLAWQALCGVVILFKSLNLLGLTTLV